MALIWGCGNLERSDENTVEEQKPHVIVRDEPMIELGKSKLVPVLETEINDSENIVYSCAVHLAWKQLKKLVKGDVDVIGDNLPSFLNFLNLNKSEKFLTDKYYVAVAGLSPEADKEIERQMQEKFNKSAPSFPPHNLIVYSYFFKELKYKYPFSKSEMDFSGKKVKSFNHSGSNSIDHLDFQYDVLYYGFYDNEPFKQGEIILKLNAHVSEDEIIIALVQPEKTLKETYDKINAYVSKEKKQVIFKHKNKKDTVLFPQKLPGDARFEIPNLNFQIENFYQELIGKNLPQLNTTIDLATEFVKFQFDENGAVVESGFTLVDSLGINQLKIPNLIFDKPFMIYLKEKDADEPYFVMWVNNPDILVAAKK